MKTIPVRVISAETVATDIRLLTLTTLDGSALPDWAPGSHIDLHLGPGCTRQYSLCGPIGDPSNYQVAVKLEPQSRGGSKFVHESLEAGSVLDISAPRNHFPLAADAGHSLLVAGGIGITPIISMARALHDKDGEFELVHFSRSIEHAAFRPELEQGSLRHASRFFDGLERDAVEQVLGDVLCKRREHGHLYLCGPQPFMETVRDVASRCGWPEGAVHLEYFAASAPVDQGVQTSFEVRLARSGVTVTVPAGKTIVEVLREQGVDIETSCEQGVCGTCVTTVLEGAPEHCDSFLTARERAQGDCMAVCISRSLSKLLVLDL
jgi:vanillate O-demethylase ferredoxin subunit